MADPKKPTARAKSAKKTTTAKKTAAPARKPAAAKRPAPKPEVLEELERFESEQDEVAARPVAIRGIEDFQADEDDDILEDEAPGASPIEAYGATMDGSAATMPAGVEDLDGQDDRSGAELLVGVACLALAASTFLPWYRGSVGNLSGFASGSFGPFVTFLGVAGFVIVLLRRLKVPVSLPLETGIILEGIGWVSVGAVMLKRLFPYKIGTVALPLSDAYFLVFNGLMISLMCAVAIAILAGRLSTGSPFVVRPKWFAGTAGKIGAAILATALLGGVTAGFMAPGDPSANLASPAEPETKRYNNRLPKCLADIPTPEGAKIIGGAEQFRNGERFYCQGSLAYGSSVAKAESAFLKLLKGEGIRFRPASQKIKGSSLILLEKPCGLVSITQPSKKKRATVNITLIPDKGCPYAPGVMPSPR